MQIPLIPTNGFLGAKPTALHLGERIKLGQWVFAHPYIIPDWKHQIQINDWQLFLEWDMLHIFLFSVSGPSYQQQRVRKNPIRQSVTQSYSPDELQPVYSSPYFPCRTRYLWHGRYPLTWMNEWVMNEWTQGWMNLFLCWEPNKRIDSVFSSYVYLEILLRISSHPVTI